MNVTPTHSAAQDHASRLAAGQACLDAALHLYLPLGLAVTCCCDPEHIGVGPKHAKDCDSPGKAPIHAWKALQIQLPTADEVRQWWHHFPYGNVGAVLGQASGLVRVDVDGLEGEALLAVWSAGDLPPTWTFRSSPAGRGLLYAWPRDLSCKSTTKASPGDHQELRLMGNGSQTVLPPSRHPSGFLYAWEPGHSPDDLPIAPAPSWLVERLHAGMQPTPHAAPPGSGSLDDDYVRVARALRAIPNHDAPYDDWLTVGMALHSTGASWARELWDDWSQQSAKFDEGKQEKSWQSFTSDGTVTIASLFHVAKQHGYIPTQRSTLHVSARNGYGILASGEEHRNGHAGNVQAAAPQTAEQALGEGDTAQLAADALLQILATTEEDAQEDTILDALPALAPLDTRAWMRLKPQLKKCVQSLNLNDLEKARNELRREAKHQRLAHASGRSQAHIAAALAQDYAGKFAYDLSRQAWMEYRHGLWKPLETARVAQLIASFMDELLGGDYTWNTLSGVEHLLRTRLAQPLPLTTPGWLPFCNGALHLETMTFHTHNPERPFLWQLPYAYDPQATCPKTQAWLHEVVGGTHDQVQVLRAYAKAVVTRRVDLQRYLETISPGGTGKGTYTRLLQALVGSENTFATEIKHLEANRFELSNLRGKVLLMITDAERYSGPVNALKAITGQDFVRMEEKFKAQRTEIAPVMVVVAANEPVQSADYTSGLVRRRLSMYFRYRPAAPRDLLSWKDGAWHGELAPEIPGVLNWVLALPDTQMEVLLQQTTETVPSLKTTWAYALVDTNPLAEWANQALILDDRKDAEGKALAAVNVGRAHKLDHTNAYEHQDTWLYPNYRAWVDDTGGKPLSSRRFTGLLHDLFANQLRLEGVEHTDDNKGSRFCGIRFRTHSDNDEPLLITKHPPPVTDVTSPVTDEPRASDGCDACDGFLHDLYGHLPPPCISLSPPGEVGVSIKELFYNPSNTSHPSLVRGRSVTDMSPPVTEPRPEGCLAVGEWAWLLSADGVQQNAMPYLCISIEQGPDGHWYARFLETDTGWPLAHCARADPPAPAVSNADPLPGHGTPPDARSPRPEPSPMEACPQCRCTNLTVLGAYRKCRLCDWRGKVDDTMAIPLQTKQE